MRPSARLVGAAVAALLVAACTVGPEEGVHVVAGEDVPYDLLDDRRPGPPTSVSDGTTVALYLVREDELVEVERDLPREAGLIDLVRLLAAGPTDAEAAEGLTTTLPDPQLYRAVDVTRGTAEVELDPAVTELDGTTQASAIAQTVFTLTARPGIGRVGFSLDGSSVEVPRGDGTLTDDALARDDFPGVLAPEG
jgi:spore germination protein GerM